MKILPLLVAGISAVMPVVSQKSGLSDRYGLKMKMLCASLYMLTGILSVAAAYELTVYSVMIISALTMGVLGDFLLGYKNKKYFLPGALFFAVGHIVYIITFLFIGAVNTLTLAVPVIILTLFAYIPLFILTEKKLKFGKLKKPVLVYTAVLLLCFFSALAKGVASVTQGNILFGLCLITAGTLFIFSDLMLGTDMGGMKRPEFLHYAVSYTYFAAQTLFAISIYFQ